MNILSDKVSWLLFFLFLSGAMTAQPAKGAKTSFQTGQPWSPEMDIRSDVALVYGTVDRPNMSFEQRVLSWKNRGYRVGFMTGSAWGDYQDYFNGKWDGNLHRDEWQQRADGTPVMHGEGIPYIVPTDSFIQYMQQAQVKRAIDAGITDIYLEEPEFWMQSGYSNAFKRAWADYYGFPWRAQHESPENTYLANQLKYHLFYRALESIFTYAKAYGQSKGMHINCYVPTHSLINYSAWQIVSPEASLASLQCVDGYIAQVWTGTSRVPNYYNGVSKERVLENAFLEYGCLHSMTAPTHRRVYFLTDPVEDNHGKDWADYQRNYQATFVAQLLYPHVDTYEVMPWPERIYKDTYKSAKGNENEERIPRSYSTRLQVMINALHDMPLSNDEVSGTQGIGVLMANSLMFQRFPEHKGYEDPNFSSFYGQTLPLLKRGVPVSLIHLENVGYPETLKNLKVLVMSYSNMKPLNAGVHEHIANWVKGGGSLVYCAADTDAYCHVMAWWNTKGNNYNAPSEHLFEQMNLPRRPDAGCYSYGKGRVIIIREEPKDFALIAGKGQQYFEQVNEAYKQATSQQIKVGNHFLLQRAAYIIAAVMDESISETPLRLNGLYIDLFDNDLSVVEHKIIQPGNQAFLFDLSKVDKKIRAKVLCGASRIYDEQITGNEYRFVAKSPLNTTNKSRILLPKKPMRVTADAKSCRTQWDERSHTLLCEFENNPQGVEVRIKW